MDSAYPSFSAISDDKPMTDHKHPFEQFEQRRQQGNERVLDTHSLATKRFFGLDKQVYADGALDARTKELLGLVAAAVLRCNDCIDYHVQQCIEHGVSKPELDEAMMVAMIFSCIAYSILRLHTSVGFL